MNVTYEDLSKTSFNRTIIGLTGIQGPKSFDIFISRLQKVDPQFS